MPEAIDVDIDDFIDLDDDPSLTLLHDRTYRVRSYRQGTDLRIRGMVRDLKPAGVYIPDDTRPLQVHHMIVDLVVAYPSLVIEQAEVVLETHPHEQCPRIEDHYAKLVGLSITRGFTHKVRELFGGPRGCTHTTALLQAMAPVAVQSVWSLRASAARDGWEPVAAPQLLPPEDRLRLNLNTCHVWAEDGELVATVLAGEDLSPPVWAERRLDELGRDAASWRPPIG